VSVVGVRGECIVLVGGLDRFVFFFGGPYKPYILCSWQEAKTKHESAYFQKKSVYFTNFSFKSFGVKPMQLCHTEL
jgi:hypothetical protein